MSPPATTARDGLLEHPDEAFAYYRDEGVGVVVVGPETARSFLVDLVARLLPTERSVVAEISRETISASGGAALLALAFLPFSGSRVFASLLAAIDIMWHEVEPPHFWRRQAERVGMVFTVGVLLVLAGLLDVGIVIARDFLDLSASYDLMETMRLRVNAKNLLDSPYVMTQGEVIRLKYYTGRQFTFGVSMDL